MISVESILERTSRTVSLWRGKSIRLSRYHLEMFTRFPAIWSRWLSEELEGLQVTSRRRLIVSNPADKTFITNHI